MSELIQDTVYNRYLDIEPSLPGVALNKSHSTGPWVVYVQRELNGPWGKREFWKYKKALKFLRKALRLGVHDAALNCRRVGFDPPYRMVRIRGKYVTGSDGIRRQAKKRVLWQPKLEPGDGEHHWCRYCRRPTVFKFYSKHKRLGVVDPNMPRCIICGASARIALMPGDNRFRVH